MSFMEAFNQEKTPFLPVLSSRSEARLRESQQQMREEWDKLISQVRGISSSPRYQCECVWWKSLSLHQELMQGKEGRWYFIWIDKRGIDPEPEVQTNWVAYSAQEEAEGDCALPFCLLSFRTVRCLWKMVCIWLSLSTLLIKVFGLFVLKRFFWDIIMAQIMMQLGKVC